MKIELVITRKTKEQKPCPRGPEWDSPLWSPIANPKGGSGR